MDIQFYKVRHISNQTEKKRKKTDSECKIRKDIISDSAVLTVPLLNKLLFYLQTLPREQQYSDVSA